MKNVSTPEQLAMAIESLVTAYMDEVRASARHAVERCLTRGSVARPPSKVREPRRAASKSAAKRRTQAELDELCEELCQQVHAQPGASIVALAAKMKMPVSSLQRPMAKLRSEVRVRSVGARHLTRYFPAVVRAAAGRE